MPADNIRRLEDVDGPEVGDVFKFHWRIHSLFLVVLLMEMNPCMNRRRGLGLCQW